MAIVKNSALDPLYIQYTIAIDSVEHSSVVYCCAISVNGRLSEAVRSETRSATDQSSPAARRKSGA